MAEVGEEDRAVGEAAVGVAAPGAVMPDSQRSHCSPRNRCTATRS